MSGINCSACLLQPKTWAKGKNLCISHVSTDKAKPPEVLWPMSMIFSGFFVLYKKLFWQQMHQDNIKFHSLLLMETKDMFFLTGFHLFEIISVWLTKLILRGRASIFFADSLHPIRQEKMWGVITVKLAEPGSCYR